MQWKFWKRGSRRKPDLPVAEVEPQEAPSRFPLLTASSATELLGLQRLIGNQAVLQMVNVASPMEQPQVGRAVKVRGK
jgi:hypothetical protein